MASKPKETKQEISILEISQGEVTFALVGRTPFIFNRVNEKARRELLLPGSRKTRADRAMSLKHNPVEEFRSSAHRRVGNGPTRLVFPSEGMKGALGTAALDIPGVRRTEIGRLTWIPASHIDIYGVPQLLMNVVRMADINKTPDIRTRAILPEWACLVTVNFAMPKLTAKAISHLMVGAGMTCGLGDYRQEKGKGSYGMFRLADADDEDFRRIVKSGGIAAQDDALAHPVCYDADSEELFSWFSAEIIKLRDEPAAKRAKPKKDEAA